MRQRLYEYLAERPAGAPGDELLDLIFTARGHDPEFGRRFLSTLLGGDERFRYDPAAGGITEIGAVRVAGGRLVDSFATLVAPGRPIPPFVQCLTGITDAMVAGAPPIADALPRFLAFAGSAVLVAHNAAFDLGHLNAAHQALAGGPLDLPAVCTLRLARRLLPELRRRSLDSVATALGIGCLDRHRALPDARIAAEILCVFLERVREHGIEHLDALLDFQHRAADGRRFVVHVPRRRLEQVPGTPGVYHLLGADGRLLYVGKAVRLRDRLASYFTNARGHSARVLDLIRHVYDFRVVETGSELAASLLEARHIRELQPPYNRQRKHLPQVGFLKLGGRDPFPRLQVTERLRADRATYVGPFASRERAEHAQSVLGRLFGLRTCPGRLAPSPEVTPCLSGQVGACTAPCATRVDQDAYRRQVEEFLAFIEGEDGAPLARLAERRDRLATEMRFEAAGDVQREITLLEGIRRRRQTVGWLLARQNFVVLLPTVDRDAMLLYGVLGGRLAIEARITTVQDLGAVVELVRERYAHCQDAPIGREDVDGTTIMAAWLRDRGEHEGVLIPLDGPDAIAERLDEIAVTVRDYGLPGPLPTIEWPS